MDKANLKMLSIVVIVILCTLRIEAKTFYVTPSSSTSCPKNDTPCYTLSHYATNHKIFTNEPDIDLVFLPGKHFLTNDFSIIHRDKFTLSSYNSSSQSSIVCNASADLSVGNIDIMQINGIQFFGCVQNWFYLVQNFQVKNCSFFAEYNNETRQVQSHMTRNISDSTEKANSKSNTDPRSTKSNFKSETQANSEGSAIVVLHSRVVLSSCKFSGYIAKYGGALHSALSNITIVNCSFTNNSASQQGGGVFISLYSVVNITKSHFVGNEANTAGAIYLANTESHTYRTAVTHISDVTLYQNEVTTMGGAMYMENIASVTLSSTSFTANKAGLGATIYITSVKLLNCNNVTFVNNSASNTGLIYFENSEVNFQNNTTFTSNNGSLIAIASNVTMSGIASFRYNVQPNINVSNSSKLLQEGGAITSFASNIVFIDSMLFLKNGAVTGGAISLTQSKLYIYGEINATQNTAHNGGGIYLFQSELNFVGKATATFSNNQATDGGGIHAENSKITVNDKSVYFTKNSATHRGGGMYLELNAKLYILKFQPDQCQTTSCLNIKIKLNFTENRAQYGGAIYVADDTNSRICESAPQKSKLSAKTECFIQTLSLYSHSSNLKSDNLKNVFFFNNNATAGSTLYGGLLDRCTPSLFSEYLNRSRSSIVGPDSFDGTDAGILYFLNITNIESSELKTQVKSDSVKVCFCNSSNVPQCDLNSSTLYKEKKPGETIKVSLAAVDEVQNIVPGSTILHHLLSDSTALTKNQSVQQTTTNDSLECTELTYNVYSLQKTEVLYLYPSGPCGNTGNSNVSITISFLHCPVGFQTCYQDSSCECDPILYSKFISQCFIDTGLVLRKENVWVSILNATQRSYLTNFNCPFDYCLTNKVNISLLDESGADSQCAFNRTGKLCGACNQDLSHVFGGSNCKVCSNKWLSLILIFALAGLALVGFLLVCNITVSVGSIDALIFYANIVGANRAIFLPFERNNFLLIFISWLNLDFGFQTCFYDGMDEYAKVWLQLVFPVYIIFLVVIVIFICNYSQYFSKLLYKRNPVATLATLILLSFTKLVRTVVAAFSFARLTILTNGINETKVDLVWLMDGNVPYFKGKHIPLVAVAIIVFFITLAYTLLLFFWQWLQGCPNKKALRWIRSARLNTIMDTYHAPFNPHYRYWTGLLLIVRAVVYLLMALNVNGDPKIPLFSILILVGSIHLLKELVKGKVFKHRALNVLEGIFLYNLLIFTAATLYANETNGNQKPIAYTSTSIAFAFFLIVLLYHFYAYIFMSFKPSRKIVLYYKSQTSERRSHSKSVNYSNSEAEPLLKGNEQAVHCNDFSKYRGPLDLIDSASFSQDHSYHSTNQSPAKRADLQQKSVVTYSVVEAIPTADENKE